MSIRTFLTLVIAVMGVALLAVAGIRIFSEAARSSRAQDVVALAEIDRTLLPALISGEVIVSIVMNLPTSGPLFVNALIKQDMYLAITMLMFLAILLIIGNLLSDLLLAWVDPRVRLE